MGTLALLFSRAVLGFNASGGDYQTAAITVSLDSIALLCYLMWRRK